MKPPTAEETLFSIKAYIGAMAALYLSMLIDLPRPFWAVTTAYIVSQPWAGAVRSKAIFRLGGTFFGCAAMVYLVPKFANYPVLMVLALSLWLGVCLYLAVLDRTPRSYLFMLAGYTAAMIGLPSVTAPETVFDTGLARVEEITAGILCAMLAHVLILPRGIGGAVIGKLDQTLRDARLWVQDALRGDTATQSAKDRRALANDITQLRLLATHVPYDTGNIRWTASSVTAMQDRMAALTPTVSSLEDRLRALRALGRPLPPALPALLDDISAWVEAGSRGDPMRAAALRPRVDALAPDVDAGAGWHDLLLVSLTARLRELIDHCDRGFALRRDIQAGLSGAPARLSRHAATSNRALHHDRGIALLSSVSAAVAIGVVCAFWIGTAWTNGATAAMMAAIFSCFFASQDDPVPGIRQFLVYTVVSIPLSALYLLVVLPAVHSFEMVALAMFPVCFACGVYIARPAHTGKAMAVFFGFSGTLALHDTNTADLVSFMDTMIAQIIGVGSAAVVAALLRRISGEYSARRIQAANWRELAAMAAADRPPAGDSYTVRMLDRIGLLYTRMAARSSNDTPVEEDTLLDLRVGNEIAELQRARRELPVADAAIRPVLSCLAEWFRGRIRGRGAMPDTFLPRLDQALARVNGAPAGSARERAIVALVGLRRGLFPQASDYVPAFSTAPAAVPGAQPGAPS
ncbi:fusaric acid resistance protein [Bordetella genomosp. 9]|uniref:Fusaric acid resistance protein n=1 Tax=Bordetella genomosp. 9 TaxID=1416803 RepID=A0A261R3G3_9BORD|nr:FUSC family protein [Bordetella genomosp. 9]OZI19150.1 fusaric acid resistance protein [Bordetella genomosp. 9]